MQYHIELAQSDATLTAVVRGRVQQNELARFVPAACGEVWSFVRTAGLRQPGRHVALYLDRQGSVEVGAEVSEPFVGNDRVQCSQLPSGRVATTVHFGPYTSLSDAHSEIREWCARHGHKCSDTSWEIYGHWDESWNADSSKIRTDVFHLLEENKANKSPLPTGFSSVSSPQPLRFSPTAGLDVRQKDENTPTRFPNLSRSSNDFRIRCSPLRDSREAGSWKKQRNYDRKCRADDHKRARWRISDSPAS